MVIARVLSCFLGSLAMLVEKLPSSLPWVAFPAILFYTGVLPAAVGELSDEELFGLQAVRNDPLDGKVLESVEKDGIVTEKIEFTSRVANGKPERVAGVFSYPRGGKNLPAIFWSMGGMAPASPWFPEIFAKKGYACLAITLPHSIRNSRARFDADRPQEGNFTLLARDQMRGVTYLSQRSEVDPARIGVGGASYGGVFATLLAGIDPRLKMGMSFFGGGNHALGTSLPQFTKLKSLDEVEVWNRTVDGAFRHKERDIPFFWAVAFNDNWFSFPAVIQTYRDAISADKRLVIMPWWRHGFPENVDRSIEDFPDTTLTRTRPPYNNPGPLRIAGEGGKAVARFDWTGGNAVRKAELIVSYGEFTPWLGWLHRACFVFPAAVVKNSASAEIPIPSRKLPLVVWANIADANEVVTSTLPVVLEAEDLAAFREEGSLVLNAFPDGDFGPEVVDFLSRSGLIPNASADSAWKHEGAQSLRVVAPADPAKPHALKLDLFHNVPGLAHEFSVWVRTEEPEEITVTLQPVRPRNWDVPVVAALVARDPRLAPLLPSWANKPEPIRTTVEAGPDGKRVALSVPVPTEAVEGYVLTISSSGRAPFWIDSLTMRPLWP